MNYDGYNKYDSKVASRYDEDRQDEEHWKAEQAFIREYTSSRNLGRLLDVPVGTGRFLEYYGNADSILGVDISKHMLKEAAQKTAHLDFQNMRLVEGDATALPCAENSFDTIICFRLMHLLPEAVVRRAFSELARVLAGTLLVQTYIASPKARRLTAVRAPVKGLLRKLKLNRKTPWSHINSYRHDEGLFVNCARTSGLTLVSKHELCGYDASVVTVLEFLKCRTS